MLGIILKQRLYRQHTIILLLNLIVTDLLILLLSLTVKIITGIPGEFLLGDSDRVRCEVCRTALVIESAINISPFLTISAMAFDRFFYIHKPFKYEKLISVKSSLATIIAIWLVGIVYASLSVGLLRNIVFDEKFLDCNWDFSRFEYFHVLSNLLLLLPYIFLLVCDVWVVIIGLRHIKEVYRVQQSSSTLSRGQLSMKRVNDQIKQAQKKKRLHLMRVFGGIIVASTLTSLPLFILGVFTFDEELTYLIPAVYTAVSLALFYSQVVIHPILESTLIVEIKSTILKMLAFLQCCKKFKDDRMSSSQGSTAVFKLS